MNLGVMKARLFFPALVLTALFIGACSASPAPVPTALPTNPPTVTAIPPTETPAPLAKPAFVEFFSTL